jgi:hypothetical protein
MHKTSAPMKANNHQVTFWLAAAGLFIVHFLVFVAILRCYPQWRMIWFMPIVIVEAGLFSVILNLLLGPSTKLRRKLCVENS